MDSLLRRFVISFLVRISEEGVLGNYLVNRYMSSEVRKISEIVRARTKEGVTIPVQKINKFRFIESRGKKRVVFTREKLKATGQI